MEKAVAELNCLKIIIDHHPGNPPFYDYGIVNTAKGSTCELVFLFLEGLGLLDRLNGNLSTCLYAGITTDTLGLQVSSSYSEIYRVVGLLVDNGAEIDKVYSSIYMQFSHHRMQLLGYCLAEKMILMPEYQVAYIWLTKEELSRFSHVKGDTEGFVNYPLSIKNINFTVLFTELEGEIKLSLRSKGDIPVNEFASLYFNGGGHRNASGGRCSLSMEETLSKFESQVKEFMTKFLKL
jgi:phosphoesterase RecJ-like protein